MVIPQLAGPLTGTHPSPPPWPDPVAPTPRPHPDRGALR